MNPLVSVVASTFRVGALHKAFRSPVSQVGVRPEILVVVKGSGHLPSIDHLQGPVADVREGRGQGFGVELTAGELAAPSDDDDYWEPEKTAWPIDDVLAFRGSRGGQWSAATGLRIRQPCGGVDYRHRGNKPVARISDVPCWLGRRASPTRQACIPYSSSLPFPKRAAQESPFSVLQETHTERQRLSTVVLQCIGRTTRDAVPSRACAAWAYRYLDSITWAEDLLSDADSNTLARFVPAVLRSGVAAAANWRGAVASVRRATAINVRGALARLFWSSPLVKCNTHRSRGA